MAEKGVAEESLSRRLSRKRESFENTKIQDGIKKRREECSKGNKVIYKVLTAVTPPLLIRTKLSLACTIIIYTVPTNHLLT